MEDDCEFTADAASRFRDFLSALPLDWEIAFPGGQHFQPAIPYAPGVVRLQRDGAHPLCDDKPLILRAELYGFWLKWDSHVDHALQHWCKHSGDRRFFAADPIFAIQGANWSTIRWRQEPSRSWDGRVPAWTRQPGDVPILLLDMPAQVIRKLRDGGKIHTGYWRNERDVDRGLTELMTKNSGERNGALEKWIRLVRAEAASFPNASVGIWWPTDTSAMHQLLESLGVVFEVSSAPSPADPS